MTCPHCQTSNVDDDHRCRRCGRRTRAVYGSSSADGYNASATATAPVYEFPAETAPQASIAEGAREPLGQQFLFATPGDSRVIAFDSLTSPATRDAIRERAAELSRPAPLKTEKYEVSPRRARESRAKSRKRDEQQTFDFRGQPERIAPPKSTIVCDAPVAPVTMRVHAALIDTAVILTGCLVEMLTFRFAAGAITLDKHTALFAVVALALIPILYKLIWAFADRDSIGTQAAGLKLVDLDGNRPGAGRRYNRAFSSFIGILAAGIGLVWVLVDEDGLGWHDHMSSTFPTVA